MIDIGQKFRLRTLIGLAIDSYNPAQKKRYLHSAFHTNTIKTSINGEAAFKSLVDIFNIPRVFMIVKHYLQVNAS